MKAYRGVDDKIRMFRPMHNMERMVTSAIRAGLPIFDGGQLLQCIRKYVGYPRIIKTATSELFQIRRFLCFTGKENLINLLLPY